MRCLEGFLIRGLSPSSHDLLVPQLQYVSTERRVYHYRTETLTVSLSMDTSQLPTLQLLLTPARGELSIYISAPVWTLHTSLSPTHNMFTYMLNMVISVYFRILLGGRGGKCLVPKFYGVYYKEEQANFLWGTNQSLGGPPEINPGHCKYCPSQLCYLSSSVGRALV